ncbi:hypothetical protein M885DRAFT_524305 [Pelagophyceae sp. CCMP2097]|nr:hypothetical protein M885DRAFT_524305 [Pelagophyceae sp. CCMP2097]|mmetsp:Transcript_21421/g.74166  ORF Transcript_21421/g.74166 Transcript_21421/m.74166 type:complete len:182 (+) Transcript_21421:1-546(+)
MASPPAAGEGEVVREVHLKVDRRFSMVKVEPKAEEAKDGNFPRNLHNAAELFLRVGMVDCAEKLRETTAAMLDVYSSDPDGKTPHDLGRAVVCWACGAAALPRGHETDKAGMVCDQCGEADQTNWLTLFRPDQSSVPWIQAKALSSAEAAALMQAEADAKRKEVEANVQKALDQRRAADKA